MSHLYADHNASSPATADHWHQVASLMSTAEANPSSIHAPGRAARSALEAGRQQVAKTLHCDPHEVIFTSGATESNNLAIHALVSSASSKPATVVLSEGEHPSVRRPLEYLERQGQCRLRWARLTPDGRVDTEHLLSLLDSQTNLLCLIHVNNETGAINPVEDICTKARQLAKDCHVHIDGVQALGKCSMAFLASGIVNTAAFSAHKIGGFKGIGCLFRSAATQLRPVYLGGHQEASVRPGTHFTAGAASFGLRCAHVEAHPDWLSEAMEQGRTLKNGLHSLPGIRLHSTDVAVTNTVNFSIDGVGADEIMVHFELARICASMGSACGSGNPQPSSTLLSMGCTSWEASNAIRISFGAGNSTGDADAILEALEQLVVKRQRHR